MPPLDDAQVTLVESTDDVLDLFAWLGERRPGFLAFDIETTGLNLGRDQIRLMQFGDAQHGWALDYQDWKGAVREVFKKYTRPLVAHNLIFDQTMLKRDGIIVPTHLANCSMVMCHLLDPIRSIALKSSAARYVDKRAWLGKDMLGEAFRKGGWTWGTIPTDHPSYWLYSALDTVLTAALADKLYPRIQEKYQYIYDVEIAAIQVLMNARLKGMRIDLPYCAQKRNLLLGELGALEPQIPCAPLKDAQVIKVFQSQGAVLTKKTPRGAIALDDDVLESLKPRFPLAGLIQEYRSKHRLVASYFDNFIGMSVNDVLHCSIKPLGARTARMSVTEPALQTIPRGALVRDAFIARDGSKLIAADYSGAEMRVMASVAQETNMIEVFRKHDEDPEHNDGIHEWTTKQIYQREEYAPEERALSKNVGFANIYGAGNPKIAAMTGNSLEQVEDFMGRYDVLFPRIAIFKQELIEKVKERARDEGEGYIMTLLGRRLPVEADKAFKGVNYWCQSTATADVLKLKLVELDAAGIGDHILLPIHDEIIFEAPDDCVEDVLQVIRDVMPERKRLACPMEIDYEVVSRWGDKYR